MMPCLFCKQPIEGTTPYSVLHVYYWCESCKTEAVYHLLKGLKVYTLCYNGYRHVCIPANKIKPAYFLRYDETDILTLDHIPDINPQNVHKWTEKLLKMKAFL